jgi:hypothetical protein
VSLPLDPRFAGSNPAEDDKVLRTIKIRCTTSFGGEIKPSAPCHKILRHVKYPYSMKQILVGKIHGHSPPVSPASLLGVSAGYCQIPLVD